MRKLREESDLRFRIGPMKAIAALRQLAVLACLAGPLLAVSACSADAESCQNLYGGSYVPTDDGGNVYCENPANGDRYLLREK